MENPIKIFIVLFTFMVAGLVLPLMNNATAKNVSVQLRGYAATGAPVMETVRLYGESYALIIGIDNYRNGWPKLRGAIRDAKKVAAVLDKSGFKVEQLLNPDSATLTRTLKSFFAIKGKNPDSRLFLWYAGHGHTINGEGYLVPADAPLPSDDQFLVTALPMRNFGSLSRLANSKHVLSVFDSCFSGTIFQTRGGAVSAAITRKTTLPVREFITSGAAGQQVRDDGSFRKYFLRALHGEIRADANRDGYLTGEELGLYLSQEISSLTNDAQTPQTGKLQDTRFNQGDFVFVLPTSPRQDVAQEDQTSGTLVDIEYWKSVQASKDPALYQSYLHQFPNGHFVELAQLKLAQLNTQQTTTATQAAPHQNEPLAYRLTISPSPSDATVRIMNIQPKYHPGIQLQAGNYHILVSKSGYKSSNTWVHIDSQDVEKSVVLSKTKDTKKPVHRPVSALKAGSEPAVVPAPAMVRIPAGLLRIGNQSISIKPFLIGKYEVRFSEFDLFCKQTGRRMPKDQGWGRANRPVIYVSFDDAEAYTQWLSRKLGKRFRLPSEAEWVFAARAGTTTQFPWGDSTGENHANCDGCNTPWKNQTAPVGSFQPNAFGLYDMQGNVWEWTAGCWRNDFSSVPADGSPSTSGNCYQSSLRGGSWNHYYNFMKANYRLRNLKTYRSDTTGFRIVQEINP